MVERRDRADFTFESVAKSFGRDFDGNFAAHAQIAGAINFTHAALTDRFEDLIRSKFVAGDESHNRYKV